LPGVNCQPIRIELKGTTYLWGSPRLRGKKKLNQLRIIQRNGKKSSPVGGDQAGRRRWKAKLPVFKRPWGGAKKVSNGQPG